MAPARSWVLAGCGSVENQRKPETALLDFRRYTNQVAGDLMVVLGSEILSDLEDLDVGQLGYRVV